MKEHARIVRITIEGLKAYDRDLVIGPRTALVGPPASGKSSVSDGLRFAALGHVPHLGGREADTAKILRGPRMVVRVDLSDGRWFTRSLGRDGSSLRMEARTSWLPAGATATAQSAAIRSLFGESDEEAAECLDLRELLEASPSARAARIEALLSATSMKPADLAALLGALLVTRLAKMPEAGIPEDREALGGLIRGLTLGLPKAIGVALVPVLREAAKTIDAGGVPAVLAFANEGKKRATQDVTRKLSARAELEDRSRGLRAPATTLDELNARRAQVSDRLAVLRSQLSQALAMSEARKAAEARLKAAEEAADDHATVRATIAKDRETAARWKKEAEEAVAGLPALPPPPVLVEADPKVAKKAAADEAKAKKLDDAAAKVLAVPKPSEPGLAVHQGTAREDRAIADAERAIEVAKADPWGQAAALLGDLAGFGFECGPTRLALVKADPYLRLVKLAAANAPDTLRLEDALAAARSAKVAALAADGKLDEENAKAQAAHESAVAAWENARKLAEADRAKAATIRKDAREETQAELARVAEANRGALEAHAAATAEATAARKAAEAKRATLLRQAASAIEAADGDAADLAAEEAEVEAARAHLAGQSDALPIDAAGAKEEVATLDVELAAIDESKREVEGADARKREVDELVAEIQRAEAERDVFTAAEWAAQRLRERDLAARGGPILDRMRTFLKAAGRTEEPYIRATKSATDFGWRRAGAELPVEALSGAETVLFVTSMALAVIDLRAPAVRCLILEAAEFGAAGPTQEVLRGIEGCAGMVDTVLLATSVPLEPGKAWTTHTLAPVGAKK